MQPAPELAVGKLLRTLSTDYSSQSLALQPITDVHAAPMQQSSAECILHSFLPVHLLALLKRSSERVAARSTTAREPHD